MYPNGIKIAKPFKVKYEGNALNFYGNIKGNCSLEIKAYNYSIKANNLSMEGNYTEIVGNMYFECDGIINGSLIISNDTTFYSKSCLINNKTYKNLNGSVKGILLINFDGNIILNGSKNEKDLFLFPMKFNKIFLIKNGKIFINGKEKNFTKYIIFRGNGNYSNNEFNGECYLLAIDGKFYDESKKIYFLPTKIIFLWAIAIGMFIISLFLKRGKFSEKDKIFTGFSIIISFLFFALSFYLWNFEIKRISGFNLLTFGNFEIRDILIISLAIVPYIIAIGTIGLPIRVTISSFFEIFGLTNIGKGIGRAIGFIFTTIWGLSLFQFLLNITLSPLLRLVPPSIK